ncbi:MAG: universal stress protein [Flavobacteriales bacterium]|nr:universal stress protein [Flavobacteriales bacterium]MCB9447987.1 universal stress protein [Flavobacteriales bacterium]
MKKILVPTDFSSCANHAADLAIAWAAKAEAGIHFLHILVTPVDWVRLPKGKEANYPEVQKAIGYAKDQLQKLEKKAEKAGVKATTFLAFDQDDGEILTHANTMKHDFIIMGSRGQRGTDNLFIGSNAQKIVRHATVPVVVVKDKVKQPSLKKIVFASSFREDVMPAFKQVLEIANMTGAHLHLLYVNVPNTFEESPESFGRLSAFQKKCHQGKSSIHIWNSLYEEKGIMDFAQNLDAGMIAMVTHGRTGVLRLIASSITEGVVNRAGVPVMSIRMTAPSSKNKNNEKQDVIHATGSTTVAQN